MVDGTITSKRNSIGWKLKIILYKMLGELHHHFDLVKHGSLLLKVDQNWVTSELVKGPL